MPTPPLRIAIIGAGPVGCTLARILSQSAAAPRLSLTVYEGEASLNVRSQGGTLDLRQGSGLDAIRAAGLMAEFEQHCRYDGESMIISDKHLFRYVSMTGTAENKDAHAPEIDRFRLRQLLLDSLPGDMIQWSKRLAEVREGTAGEGYTLVFRDGTTAGGFDLVVGADGAWSKVRPLVSDATPTFARVGGYSFTVSNVSKVCPETVALVNGGNIFSVHDHKFFSHQRMGDDVMQMACYSVKDDAKWTEKVGHGDGYDFEVARRYVLDEQVKDWDPALRMLLERCSGENTKTMPWSLYELPVGHSWAHRRGVTLVGDAAHLMTPFAGEGVNQGLTDANVLAAGIVKAVKANNQSGREAMSAALDGAVAAYEKEMFVRMSGKMDQTQKMKDCSFFLPGGLYANIERWMLAAVEDDLPVRFVTVPLARAAVYTYFAFVRWWYKPQH